MNLNLIRMDFVLYYLSSLNYLAILVATIATFMFGWLWYSPMLFGKPWMKMLGFTEEQLKNAGGMGKLMAIAFVVNFFLAVVIACFMLGSNMYGGIIFGAVVGLLLHGPAVATSYLFERKPLSLWLINVFHDTIAYTIVAVIVAVWK